MVSLMSHNHLPHVSASRGTVGERINRATNINTERFISTFPNLVGATCSHSQNSVSTQPLQGASEATGEATPAIRPHCQGYLHEAASLNHMLVHWVPVVKVNSRRRYAINDSEMNEMNGEHYSDV